MALYSDPAKLGSTAPDFTLPGVDGKTHRLSDFRNSQALVVVFMCNHCPYVIATQGRINTLAREYASRQVQFIAINSNDSVRYPDDSFDQMKVRAQEQNFSFPYLHDESQAVARAYGAVCTPEFYLYGLSSGEFTLQYRGRMDDNWKDESAVTRRDLALALDEVLAGKLPDSDQKPSMGCSIKWKA